MLGAKQLADRAALRQQLRLGECDGHHLRAGSATRRARRARLRRGRARVAWVGSECARDWAAAWNVPQPGAGEPPRPRAGQSPRLKFGEATSPCPASRCTLGRAVSGSESAAACVDGEHHAHGDVETREPSDSDWGH